MFNEKSMFTAFSDKMMLASKWLMVLALFTLVLVIATAANAAAPGAIDGRIEWQWGNQLAAIIVDQVGWAATALVGAAIHFAPVGTRSLIYMFRVDQLLEKAVKAGINKTAGAVQGKVLVASVGNEVLERALEYVIYHAPKLYKTNTVQMWRDKIIARLNLADSVSADPVVAGFLNTRG